MTKHQKDLWEDETGQSQEIPHGEDTPHAFAFQPEFAQRIGGGEREAGSRRPSAFMGDALESIGGPPDRRVRVADPLFHLCAQREDADLESRRPATSRVRSVDQNCGPPTHRSGTRFFVSP